MGTIDKHIFESHGARGCSNSDYNLVRTTCCNQLLVEDTELNDIYFDAKDLSKVIHVLETAPCPVCHADTWDYLPLEEWPKVGTNWQWAYHQDGELIRRWLNT